jgi:hypothetical protein
MVEAVNDEHVYEPKLARYINGASCLWIGRKKEAGKGLGWSNLKFDQIIQK